MPLVASVRLAGLASAVRQRTTHVSPGYLVPDAFELLFTVRNSFYTPPQTSFLTLALATASLVRFEAFVLLLQLLLVLLYYLVASAFSPAFADHFHSLSVSALE